MAGDPRPWIDVVLARAAELREAGVLSIACEGNSAVFAPAAPGAGTVKEPPEPELAEDPVDAWENPNSYPTGIVPTLDVDPEKELPEIPVFDD